MSDIVISKITRSYRQSIGIQITPQGEVIVRAPHLMPKVFIEKFVEQKKEWILGHVTRLQAVSKPAQKKYIDGETFLYLGKEYPLRIGSFTQIQITDALEFPIGLQFRIKKELENWYIAQAKKKIKDRLEFHSQRMGTAYKSLFFSDTKSKWGTCGPDNSLQFNWRLIMAPLPVLDYVVIHELAHTKEKNHSSDFWSLVRLYTPAYRQHRKWLNENNGRMVV